MFSGDLVEKHLENFNFHEIIQKRFFVHIWCHLWYAYVLSDEPKLSYFTCL